MPFGDRTGPRGEGAMTGWGRGYCTPGDTVSEPGRWSSGFPTPLRNRRGFGRGGRWGGRGLYRGGGPNFGGWRMADQAVPVELSADDEVRRLQARAADVKSELNALEDRLARLEAQSRRPDPGKADD